MDAAARLKLFRGENVDINQLEHSNIVRIFISSTFSGNFCFVSLGMIIFRDDQGPKFNKLLKSAQRLRSVFSRVVKTQKAHLSSYQSPLFFSLLS